MNLIQGQKFDIVMKAGADFHLAFTIKDSDGTPLNLVGATVIAHLREYPEAKDAFEFTATHNGEGGKISLSMPYNVTSGIWFTKGCYDVYTVQGGEKKLWLFGDAKIYLSTTR